MEIIPLRYGRTTLPESMVFQNGDKEKIREIDLIFYLVTVDERKILVDSGCDTMPGFDLRDFCGPFAALRTHGLSPNDITDVIITHAHHDHIECVEAYKNAVVYIQRDEYEKGKKYFGKEQKTVLFDDELEIYKGILCKKIGGHSIGSSIVIIDKDEREYVIVGDECYSKECLSKKIPTGSSKNLKNSIAFINTYSDSRYICLLCHEL